MTDILDNAQVDAYLLRLGIEKRPEPSREALDALVLAHQCSIPFETVTLHRGNKTPTLDLAAIYDKVVARRLGGYCFELNKLFESLLASLGFDARPVLCRSVRGRDGRMPINHRGIVVRIGIDEFSADVGFGGPMPAGALLLSDGAEQDICGETYAPRRGGRGWWKIERVTRASRDLYDDAVPERRQVELELCEAAVEEIDFDALNLCFSQHGTLFRDHEVVNLRTEHGYRGFKDGVLTLRENGEKTVIACDADEIDEVLEVWFGMREL